MDNAQPGILAEETRIGRYLTFSLHNDTDLTPTLTRLQDYINPETMVVGFGLSLTQKCGADIPGLRKMPTDHQRSVGIPSTPGDIWIWLRGDDRGKLFHRSREIEKLLTPTFHLSDVTDSFQYDENRDLSGYIDGTENPAGAEAVDASVILGSGSGLDGGSMVAVQKWQHDFSAFDQMSVKEQDDAIGRHISDNEEFDEAPESAHVKRSAQESFEPEAFMLRRSMPWAEGMDAGLMFVSFVSNFDAFEAILDRMLGKEDGIQDALFSFTKPLTGTYYWCPPIKDGKLDLSRLISG